MTLWPWSRRTPDPAQADALLAALARCGIAPAPDLPAAALEALRGLPRLDRADGPERLLIALGEDEVAEDAFEGPPRSPDIWHYDAECIEDHGDYAAILRRLGTLAGGDLPLTQLRDHVDVEGRVAWASFELDGHPHRLEFQVRDDWADPEIFVAVQRLLRGRGSTRVLAMHDLGQDGLVVCLTPDRLAALNRLPGLAFSPVA